MEKAHAGIATSELVRDLNRAFYDVEAPQYDARHPEVVQGARSLWLNQLFPCMEQNVSLTSPRIFLDLGAGTGFVSDLLLPRLTQGDRLFCCDLSPAMLTEAQRKLKGRGRVVGYCGVDAARLPFADHSITIITMNALLHHSAEYGQILAECKRVIKDGGCLIIAHEPNRAFFKSPLVRIAAFLYKLAGQGKTINREMAQSIRHNLQKHREITGPLTADKILGMVEFHSPVEQSRLGVGLDKGFVPEELIRQYLPEYSILLLKTYTTAFERPLFTKNGVTRWIANRLKSLLGARGNHFCLIAQKALPVQE